MSNLKYENYCECHNKEMYDLFCEFRDEDNFYMDLSYEAWENLLLKSRNFTKEGTFLCFDDKKLVGYVSMTVRESDFGNEKASGYLHTLIVKKDYRRQGIGSKLLDLAESYVKEKELGSSRSVFLSGICYPWYIPHTNKHLHPGCPAVVMNSEFYIFLYHHHYAVNSIHEGFHLDLVNYEYPEKVKEKMKENAEKGIVIEMYDPNKHFGVDEFCEAIQNPGFAGSIKRNLAKEQPLPFIVASDNGKMVGWTGAVYTEASGRGHLDGIAVHPDYRNHGLGKGVFNKLCMESKNNKAEYMTFFTGLDNPARYIYLGAGFKIACSFADMKKNF